jgi:Gpi18-like mannosyltransferase
VWLNSAYWGQCDAIYTTFLLFSIYFLLKDKPIWGMIMYGIGFSFKLQAIFLLPFIIAILIGQRSNWKNIFIIPMTIFAAMIPALIEGLPSETVFSIYLNQSQEYPSLTLNAPSIFGFFSDYDALQYSGLGYLFAAISVLFIWWLPYQKKGIFKIRDGILLACLSAFVLPFFLPRMHERYFYLAAAISILLFFYHPKLILPAILINLATYFSYFDFLWGNLPIPLQWLSAINTVALVILIVYSCQYFVKKPIVSETISVPIL